MKVDVLLGLQWGDEGKGKVVDVLSPKYDMIARFQGGPNAGHTIEFNSKKFILHTIPSGIFYEGKINIIGNGVIIDPLILVRELQMLRENGYHPEKNLYVSKKSHLILPSHRLLDALYESQKGKNKIGSTLKGIGPTYTDKTARNGLRVGDVLMNDFTQKYMRLRDQHLKLFQLFGFDFETFPIEGISFETYEKNWFEGMEQLKELQLIDSEYYINQQLDSGKTLLAEGAQGTMLDVDFGTYPFVTSSNTTTAGVCAGLGVPPKAIKEVYGIFKAYCTRVGSGPFPTELDDEDGQRLRVEGNEFGSTTGRPRRCGWLDLVALKYAIMLNGVTQLVMTKVDVLNDFHTIKVGMEYHHNDQLLNYFPFEAAYRNLLTNYQSFSGWKTDIANSENFQDIPEQLKKYLSFIEDETKVPVSMMSVGPGRDKIILR